jgi:hypothetical protein
MINRMSFLRVARSLFLSFLRSREATQRESSELGAAQLRKYHERAKRATDCLRAAMPPAACTCEVALTCDSLDSRPSAKNDMLIFVILAKSRSDAARIQRIGRSPTSQIPRAREARDRLL